MGAELKDSSGLTAYLQNQHRSVLVEKYVSK